MTPHNEYLEVLTGFGFLGLLFFLFAIVPPVVAASKGWKKVPDDRRGVAAGALSGARAHGDHALFNFNFHEAASSARTRSSSGRSLDASLAGSLATGCMCRRCFEGGSRSLRFCCASSRRRCWRGRSRSNGVQRLSVAGDLDSAERYFRLASILDPARDPPFRMLFPALGHRRYLKTVRPDGGGNALEHLEESIRRLEKAGNSAPWNRDTHYRLARPVPGKVPVGDESA